MTASSHQVHHNVFVEGVPPLGGHLAHIHHSLWVVGVHMEDGSVHDSCHVRGVRGWARHPGVCGKTDLCWWKCCFLIKGSKHNATPAVVQTRLLPACQIQMPCPVECLQSVNTANFLYKMNASPRASPTYTLACRVSQRVCTISHNTASQPEYIQSFLMSYVTYINMFISEVESKRNSVLIYLWM